MAVCTLRGSIRYWSGTKNVPMANDEYLLNVVFFSSFRSHSPHYHSFNTKLFRYNVNGEAFIYYLNGKALEFRKTFSSLEMRRQIIVFRF